LKEENEAEVEHYQVVPDTDAKPTLAAIVHESEREEGQREMSDREKRSFFSGFSTTCNGTPTPPSMFVSSIPCHEYSGFEMVFSYQTKSR
jgi:hypothetical protein